MLHNISWANYLTAVAVFTIIYYLFIGYRYFSTEIKELLSGKRSIFLRASNPKAHHAVPDDLKNHPVENAIAENTMDDEYQQVEHLIERLKNVIEDASGKNVYRDELKEYLSLVLMEFPALKSSPLRASINELIASECEKNKTVSLSEDEVDKLWWDAN